VLAITALRTARPGKPAAPCQRP